MEFRRVCLLVLFACLWGIGAWSQNVQIAIGEQPPLFSEKGGIIDMVVKESLARSGLTAQFTWYPIGRMLKLLETNQTDIYVTPSNTPGQQNPHIHLLAARGVFFYLKSRFPTGVPQKLEDLSKMRVATVINSPLKPMFEKYGMIVDEGPYETLMPKLVAGRVDFTATADVGGLLAIKNQFPGRELEFSFTDFAYMEISAGLYVKDTPANLKILEACQTGFVQMKADGSLDAMLHQFFGPVFAKRVKVL